jgi:hypothetical protein
MSGRDANHAPLPSAEEKNEWSYISTPLSAFMLCLGTTFRILSLEHDIHHSNVIALFNIFMM